LRQTYWSFYWPLALTGTTTILASQFQNGALARYPDASRELALFAYASGLFFFCRAAFVFVPQMSNLLARNRQSHRVCLTFVVVVACLLTVPLLALGLTEAGASIVSWMFEVKGGDLETVRSYLRFLAPLVLVDGLRQHGIGLVIQQQATRVVTLLNLVEIGLTFGLLALGVRLGWAAVPTLVVSQWGAWGAHLSLLALFLLRSYRMAPGPSERLTYAEANRFFWPVALTSLMFAVSRPILYAFVSRAPVPVASVAAMRVAFDVALFFHQPLNQFRNLYATFGTSDLEGLKRFQLEVVLAMTGAMILVSFSSLDTLVLSRVVGLEGTVLTFTEQAVRVMCLLPLVVGFRNYYHGVALARLTTGSMASAAVLRVVAIYAAAAAAQATGILDHVWASAILVFGFAVEAMVMRASLTARPAPRAGA
jgi:hypothetical protein